jgi:hypothetical protein
MRKHQLDHIVESNINLEQYSNNRVFIAEISPGLFCFTSKLSFYKSEMIPFIKRFICKRSHQEHGNYSYIAGNCSSPYGYYW